MPSPIAHTAMGYLVYQALNRFLPQVKEGWPGGRHGLLATTVVASLLPDIDVLPVFVLGDMARFHNNMTHSLLMGVLVAVAAGVLVRLRHTMLGSPLLLVILLCYEFHVLMDFLTKGRGVMLFWPVDPSRYQAPIKLFYGMQWGTGWASTTHLWTVTTELALIFLVGLVLRVMFRNAGPSAVVGVEKS